MIGEHYPYPPIAGYALLSDCPWIAPVQDRRGYGPYNALGRAKGTRRAARIFVPFSTSTLESEVAWLLPEGTKPYWRGHITEIDYEFAQ